MKLTSDERRTVYQAVRDESILSQRFAVLICLSSGIAAFGLLANSSAAIIGAMIVAPLMGPILGSALGMAMGLDGLFRRSLLAEVVGVACAIGIGFLVGSFPFHPAPGSEIINRTAPNLFDLGVALVSGLAGAYATTNAKVNPALAGVAISVSLVPPLASCGVLLAFGMERMAIGAFSLFLVNFLSIQLAAAAVFILAGFRPTIQTEETRKAYYMRFAPTVVALIAMVFLGTKSLLNLLHQQNTRRTVERVLTAEIRQRTGCSFDKLIELKDDGKTLHLVASALTSRPYEADQVGHIDKALEKALGRDVDLVIRSLPSSDMSATGRVYLESSEAERLVEELTRTRLRDTFVAALSPVRGARLASLDLTHEAEMWSAVAVVYAPVPVTPERVAEIESAMATAAGKAVRLRVETSNIVAADRDSYVDPAATDGDLLLP